MIHVNPDWACSTATTWSPSFDETVVHVKRVIAYWSRTFKDAELRYSTTGHKALGAKEGLVKFQPFIEGEHILLVTNHAALQWTCTYENANQHLAAWGAVFSAYSPKLEIIHRPGRIHSNIDPLSRLPRPPPSSFSPVEPTTKVLHPDNTLAEFQEQAAASAPAKCVFVCI